VAYVEVLERLPRTVLQVHFDWIFFDIWQHQHILCVLVSLLQVHSQATMLLSVDNNNNNKMF
jgi:hypothetical protein